MNFWRSGVVVFFSYPELGGSGHSTTPGNLRLRPKMTTDDETPTELQPSEGLRAAETFNQCTAANGGGPSQLPSTRPVAAVAELGS